MNQVEDAVEPVGFGWVGMLSARVQSKLQPAYGELLARKGQGRKNANSQNTKTFCQNTNSTTYS